MEEVIGYIRKSTKDGKNQKFSLSSQTKAIEEFCSKEGMKLLKTFQDEESGTKKDRAGLKEALQYAEQNKTPIVVLRVDRLSRTPSQTFGIMENPNLRIYITELGLSADPMLISLLILHSKMEIDLLSRRVREGMKTALLKRRETDPMFRWGIQDWTENIQKMTQARIKGADQRALYWKPLFTSLMVSHRSYNQVAIALNRLEIKTHRGKTWSRKTVRGMLLRIQKLDKDNVISN